MHRVIAGSLRDAFNKVRIERVWKLGVFRSKFSGHKKTLARDSEVGEEQEDLYATFQI